MYAYYLSGITIISSKESTSLPNLVVPIFILLTENTKGFRNNPNVIYAPHYTIDNLFHLIRLTPIDWNYNICPCPRLYLHWKFFPGGLVGFIPKQHLIHLGGPALLLSPLGIFGQEPTCNKHNRLVSTLDTNVTIDIY